MFYVYSRQLYKLQKLFKSQIKAQKQAEAEAKNIPLSLLYDEQNIDPDQLPPPLKICNIALEAIAEFRVRSNLIFNSTIQYVAQLYIKYSIE